MIRSGVAKGKVTDHGVALDIKNVPWAGRQMWAPDAAERFGKYYLYFPVKDKQDHDAQISGGQTHLRNIKVTELKHRADGTIVTIDAYIE
jgi:beta-xylosidase